MALNSVSDVIAFMNTYQIVNANEARAQIVDGVKFINDFKTTINPNAINERDVIIAPGVYEVYLTLQRDAATIARSVNEGEIKKLIDETYDGSATGTYQGGARNYYDAIYSIKERYGFTSFKDLFNMLRMKLEEGKKRVSDKISELYFVEYIVPKNLDEQLQYGNNSVRYVPYNPEPEGNKNFTIPTWGYFLAAGAGILALFALKKKV